MREPWFIYALVFCSTLLAVFAVYRFFSRDRATSKQINRRLALIETNSNTAEVLEILKRERGIAAGRHSEHFEGLQRLFIQSGLRFGLGTIILSLGSISFVVTLAITALLGFYVVNIVV